MLLSNPMPSLVYTTRNAKVGCGPGDCSESELSILSANYLSVSAAGSGHIQDTRKIYRRPRPSVGSSARSCMKSYPGALCVLTNESTISGSLFPTSRVE